MVFCSHEELDKAQSAVEKIVQKLVTYFETHQSKKTEFIIVSTPSINETVEHSNIQVKDQIIETSSCVKYFGVCLDRELIFQNELKNTLRKMATRYKGLYKLKNIVPEETRLFLLNAFVISHSQYSVILLGGIRKSVITTLKKDLNWGIKAFFNKTKYEISSDIKKRRNILPVRF